MRQSRESELSEIILLRMIEAIEGSMADESVQLLVPHQVMTQLMMDSYAQLRTWTDRSTEKE